MAAFLLICFSGILDIFSNLALAKSDGFKKLWWGLLALLLVDSCFVALAFALDLGMQLPVAYTLWGAIGILGTTAGDIIFSLKSSNP